MIDDAASSRRAFLAGAAATVGAAGLAILPAVSAEAAPVVRRPAAGRRVIASDRQGFNRRWYAPNLKAAFVPIDVGDVADHVQAALRAYGRHVRVTSGRHCYENFVYSEDTLAIIDMSLLSSAGFDRDRDAYFIDAGCELWTAYRSLLNGFAKTIPGGSCYSVGAGGHISGGGYGLLSRLHGLTVDHLSAVDIVTWDASTSRATMRNVSASSSNTAERDLFWALCGGGGGNFGVIARYWFKDLPDAPGQATVWTLAWDWSDLTPRSFADLVAEYADMCTTLPEAQFAALKLTHVAAGQVGMFLQVASRPGRTAEENARVAEAQVEAVRSRFQRVARSSLLAGPLHGQPAFLAVPPKTASPVHYTYLEALQELNGVGANQFGKYKSAYMRKPFPDDQVAAIYDWLHTTPEGVASSDMAPSLLQVDSYGGAINRRRPSATPIPQRSSIMKLQYQSYWNNSSPVGRGDSAPYRVQSDAHLRWMRDFYTDVYAAYGGTPDPQRDPSGTVDGCYYNYPDSDLGTHAGGDVEQALRLYFGDNLRRNPRNLVTVKRRWDPQDFFHGPQSIPTH